MDETKYWLAFSNLQGVGAASINKIWKHFKSMKEAWSASSSDYYEIEGLNSNIVQKIITVRNQISPDKLMEEVINNNINILCLPDESYPELLKQIYDPPAVIYYRGNFKACDFKRTIGIVGTRKPSEYGQEVAYKISRDLANYGVTIVSGLAEGVDTRAHTACLEVRGKTIAVLGSGLNFIYPKINKNLSKKIIEENNGAVISEYPPDFPPDTWSFPYRNRVISGLSYAIVVIESKARGGSLLTAKSALEQNRDVFAVPSRVNHDYNDGGHNLIQKGEAKIFTSYEKLFETLNWTLNKLKTETIESTSPKTSDNKEKNKQNRSKTVNVDLNNKNPVNKSEQLKETIETNNIKILSNNISPEEINILELLGNETSSFDVLKQKSGLETPVLLSSLTILELNGIIISLPGKRYKKNINVT